MNTPNKWLPRWYGLMVKDVDGPEELCTDYKRYQYLRFLITRIAAEWGNGSPWEYSKNMEIIKAAEKQWDSANYWEWPSWIMQEQLELMAFLLGHIDILHSQGPAPRAT